MQILIVDDQRSIRAMVRSELRQLGLDKVTEAEDGNAALALMARNRFDLVVTDLNMPGLDGMGLLRAMRKDPRTARIPVVLLTGAAIGGSIAEAAKLGVVDVIAKPFTMGGFAKRFSLLMAKLAQRKAAAAPSPPPSPAAAPVIEID